MDYGDGLPEDWRWSGIAGSDIPLPPGWTAATRPGLDPIATLYAPEEGDDGLRPTLVVRRGASRGASLAAISSQGVSQLLATWDGSTIVSHDATHLQGFEVRAQRFLLEAAERSAVLERWLVATGETVVELSGTAPVSRFLEVGPVLEQMIMGARYAEAAPTSPEPTADGYPEPSLDDQMSAATGLRLEALEDLRREQRYLLSGPTLTGSALRLMQDSAPSATLGGDAADRFPEEVDLLQRQGLVSGGRFSEDARRFMDPVVHQQAYLRVTLEHRGRESQLHLWLGEEGVATLAAGAPLHNLVEFSDEDHGRLRDIYVLDLVTPEGIPAVVARWMGLAPVWPVHSGSLRMTSGQLEARVADGPGAAADPTASLGARISDAEWVSVTLEQVPVGVGPSITLVHALGAGFFQPEPRGGDYSSITDDTELQFTPLPPRQVLDLVVGVIDHLLSDD